MFGTVEEIHGDVTRAGSYVLVLGRNSGFGKGGVTRAVMDLLDAARHLPPVEGVLIRSMPESLADQLVQERLEERLGAARPMRAKDAEGRAFQLRTLLVEDFAHAHVLLLLGSGSASKVTKEAEQMWAKAVSDVLDKFAVGLIAMSEISRFNRSPWALSSRDVQQLRGSYLYSSKEHALERWDEEHEGSTFLRLKSAENESKTISLRARNGQIRVSRRWTEDGHPYWGLPQVMPPGLITLRKPIPGNRQRLDHPTVYLNRPADLPHPSKVALGYPWIPSGLVEPPDQVANVRLALAMLSEGEDPTLVVQVLVARHFITPRMVRNRGADAVLRANDPLTRLHAVLSNLKYYESGIFSRRVGEAVASFEYGPSEGWMAPGQADKVRATIRIFKATHAHRGGPKATFGGLPIIIHHYDANPSTSRLMRYAYDPAYYTDDERRGRFFIRAELFAASILEGIIEAGPEFKGTPFEAQRPHDPALELAKARLADCDVRVARLSVRKADLEREAIDGVLARSQRVVRLVENELERIDTEIDSLRSEQNRNRIEVEELAVRHKMLLPIPAQRLLPMVSSLADPAAREYRAEWFKVIRELRVISGNGPASWEGTLEFRVDDFAIEVPFHGVGHSTDRVAPERRLESERRLLEKLRRGEPLGMSSAAMEPHRHSLLALLGLRNDHDRSGSTSAFYLLYIADSRLLRLTVAIAEGRVMETYVKAEDPALIARIEHLLETHNRTQWLSRRANWDYFDEAVAYAAAHRGLAEWAFLQQLDPVSWRWRKRAERSDRLECGDAGLFIVPCGGDGGRPGKTCNSRQLWSPLFPEATGLVCCRCGRDEAGVFWPPSYERAFSARGCPVDPFVERKLTALGRVPSNRPRAQRRVKGS